MKQKLFNLDKSISSWLHVHHVFTSTCTVCTCTCTCTCTYMHIIIQHRYYQLTMLLVPPWAKLHLVLFVASSKELLLKRMHWAIHVIILYYYNRGNRLSLFVSHNSIRRTVFGDIGLWILVVISCVVKMFFTQGMRLLMSECMDLVCRSLGVLLVHVPYMYMHVMTLIYICAHLLYHLVLYPCYVYSCTHVGTCKFKWWIKNAWGRDGWSSNR